MKKFPFKEFFDVIKYPLLFVVICWILFWMDHAFHLNLHVLGVSPRTAKGAIGIITSPFIHGDLSHIANNSVPVLVLGSLLFYFYRPIAWPVVLWIYFISGVWLWIGGRNNEFIPYYHFGASTLIYGFSTFLFFSGVFRKHKQLMVVSTMVVFLYGSITWGIFPFDKSMSWEGHLFGAIAGVLVAYNYRKEGPQAKPYYWPEEEVDLEAIYYEQLRQEQELAESIKREAEEKSQQSQDSFKITYTFIPKEKDGDDKL